MRQVVIAERIARYAVRIAHASRPGGAGTPEFVEKWVKSGRRTPGQPGGASAGPKRRAALILARYHVSIKDIQALAKPILRHRIMTNFYAESSASRRTPSSSG